MAFSSGSRSPSHQPAARPGRRPLAASSPATPRTAVDDTFDTPLNPHPGRHRSEGHRPCVVGLALLAEGDLIEILAEAQVPRDCGLSEAFKQFGGLTFGEVQSVVA